MKKLRNLLAGLFSILVLFACKEDPAVKKENIARTNQKSIYEFSYTDLSGETFDFSDLKGKKIMIVNTASKCGLTPQYEQLQALYEEYKDENFVIVGFPANNFMSQEPGSNKQISEFCTTNYGITFPMMEKISVKGEDQASIYTYLTSKELNGVEDSEVSWNFQKYLIDEQGTLIRVVSPKTLPNDPEIITWIES